MAASLATQSKQPALNDQKLQNCFSGVFAEHQQHCTGGLAQSLDCKNSGRQNCIKSLWCLVLARSEHRSLKQMPRPFPRNDLSGRTRDVITLTMMVGRLGQDEATAARTKILTKTNTNTGCGSGPSR